MQWLKRVFNIDIEVCEQCESHVKVIASIEDPLVIEKILTHLNQQEAKAETIQTQQLNLLADNRAPPALQISLFD